MSSIKIRLTNTVRFLFIISSQRKFKLSCTQGIIYYKIIIRLDQRSSNFLSRGPHWVLLHFAAGLNNKKYNYRYMNFIESAKFNENTVKFNVKVRHFIMHCSCAAVTFDARRKVFGLAGTGGGGNLIMYNVY